MIWVNGVLQGSIDPSDRGLTYGDGLFATMRTSHDGILFLNAHQSRLTDGAARLGLNGAWAVRFISNLRIWPDSIPIIVLNFWFQEVLVGEVIHHHKLLM